MIITFRFPCRFRCWNEFVHICLQDLFFMTLLITVILTPYFSDKSFILITSFLYSFLILKTSDSVSFADAFFIPLADLFLDTMSSECCLYVLMTKCSDLI